MGKCVLVGVFAELSDLRGSNRCWMGEMCVLMSSEMVQWKRRAEFIAEFRFGTIIFSILLIEESNVLACVEIDPLSIREPPNEFLETTNVVSTLFDLEFLLDEIKTCKLHANIWTDWENVFEWIGSMSDWLGIGGLMIRGKASESISISQSILTNKCSDLRVICVLFTVHMCIRMLRAHQTRQLRLFLIAL